MPAPCTRFAGPADASVADRDLLSLASCRSRCRVPRRNRGHRTEEAHPRVVRSAPGSLLEGATMANKDKGGSKSSKTAASKSLKEKRQAKKAKVTRSGGSSMGASTNR